jgi:tRNA threonylcarbamoyladenosine biosynthesis protein TsaE
MSDALLLPDHAATVSLGHEIAAELLPGDVVLLHGDLGAGKTTLAQGIAAALGVNELIQSPTFALVAEHQGRLYDGTPITLYHLDLYRLESPDELEEIGYDQYLAPLAGVSLIEWPERAGDWLPERFLLLRLTRAAHGGREVELSRHGY